jgi:phage virion morphogenesis protein
MAITGMVVDYGFHPSPLIMAGEMETFGLNVRSFREPLTRAVKQVMIPSIQQNFNVGGRPAWQPVSDATDQIKFAGGFNGGPLIRTGTLKRNMGYQSMWTIDKSQAAIQDLPERIAYGSVHQAGSSSGSGRGSNIPARPFATIQDADEERIEDVFATWLAERAAAVGW